MRDLGNKVDGWEEAANQKYPFKKIILELMEESRQKPGPVSRIFDFRGKQYLLEVRYLAHDQKSQRDAFVYTFEDLA